MSRGNARQLFDHRKDDPVRFSVLARPSPAQQSQAQVTSVLSGTIVTRPTPKYPPNDHVSASSTSSMPHLWTYGFHKPLESLRRASFNSPLALEHPQDFIYYAYFTPGY